MSKIDIDQDLEFQEKEWSAERAGWIVGLVLLLAALAGLFGNGPLSSATRVSGPLQVTWERLCRYNASMDLVVQLANPQVSDEGIQLWIDRAYIETFEIESIVPEPEAMHEEGERLVVTFRAPPSSTSFHAVLQIRPQKAGVFHGRLGQVGGSGEVQLEQVIFP
jgi:hypothetical protein